MSDDPAHGHQELIIKKHGGGHEDGHHGGVWKIAFADFMTAMMAFFLVMWLISANDKTKATIAKYFNPIELVDSRPQPRGLNDAKKDDPQVPRKPDVPPLDGEGKQTKPTENGGPAGGAQTPRPIDASPLDDADQSARHSEMEIIRDPYAVIAEIASKQSVDPPKSTPAVQTPTPAGGAAAVGLKGGDAFRDPFEPLQVTGPNPLAGISDSAPPGPGTTAAAAPESAAAAGAPPHGPSPAGVAAEASPSAPSGAAPTASAKGPASETPAVPAPPSPMTAAASATAAAAVAPGAEHAPDKPLSPAVLRAKLAALGKEEAEGGPGGQAGPGLGPKVEVRRTDEGTLISLTDSAEFSMFASASARPSPKTIALMERIGRLLKAQKGGVTIRGFTDSRPFRSDTYDNWRLSTERAHLAQYMLARGGLDDSRIDRIEGYADRRPKTPKDPEGAENRRIEILLRDTTP